MIKRFSSLIFLAVFISLNVNAADKVASVVLSLGKNTAQLLDQDTRILKRKSSIYSQDLINTGSKGQLQLRFTDNSRVSLRPDTLFRVDEYRFQKNVPGDGKSVYRLLKGGLRTITGAISHANVDNYQIKTPIATIGVRGTHYSLFYCDKSCQEATRSKIGLYGYVLEGEIVVGNDAIRAPISAGRYFFLGGNGSSLQIRKTAFDLFEKLEGLGPDLMSESTGGSIPALDVHSGSSVRGTDSPVSPASPGGPSNYP
jgi:hypothetical protein